MTTSLTARNAGLSDLAELLKTQQAAKVDIVTPLVNLRSTYGIYTIAGTSVFGDGQTFSATEIADEHIAAKLGIPGQYLRRMRSERVDLYDANVNGWIHGKEGAVEPDTRTVTLRTFQGDPGEQGVLRAVLSDRYGLIDNLDVLTAALEGVREAGTPVQVVGCDLTERRMQVRISAPEIFSEAPELLAGYRSPFQGRNLPQWAQEKFGVGGDGVFAGLVISNSETGGSAFSIFPRLTVLQCMNGMTMTKDALRRVHLGSRMEEGVVEWSSDTQRKALELVTAQTRDAVKAYLSPEYLEKALEGITRKAGTPIEKPAEAVEVISKQLGFTEAEREGVLGFFIQGGQLTAGGILQAVSAFAQQIESPDAAWEMELSAMRALDLASA